jgi:aldehyde:ferredoxin oxidoreductase
MKLGGFAGKVLSVNLTTGEIREEPLGQDMPSRFLGGLGTSIKLAYDHIIPKTNPLSPENLIVLGVGPFVGTNIPASSRVYAITKLPASQTIGWCGAGGPFFGYALKHSGYDHLVITGRASHPVYLTITDNDVQIGDASSFWGKGIDSVTEDLSREMGPSTGVLAIGPAGEKKVVFSMAFIDGISSLGRGGVGAVMGSKNLKAIAVKGHQSIHIADRPGCNKITKKLYKEIRNYPYLKDWQDLGLLKSLPAIPHDVYYKIKKKRIACISCPVGDKDIVEIKDGVHTGLVKKTSSAVNLFSPMIYGMKDYRDAIKCMSVLDDYGMDMFEFFGIMECIQKCREKGLLDQDGIEEEIRTDSLSSMLHWIEQIKDRNGLGDTLADGFNGIFSRFGQIARDLSPPVIKGMLPYVGPKGPLPWNLFGTMELGQVLEPRGPHVGASGSPTYFAKRPPEVFPKHLKRMGVPGDAAERILGLETSPGSSGQRKDLDVGRLLVYSHNWFVILGSLGLCARAQVNRFYDAELCARLYEKVTGIPTSIDDLRLKADRAWTLLRMANIREGVDRKADHIPESWYKKEPFRNYTTEEPLALNDYHQMIDSYYEERGWDKKTGIPLEEKLKKLDLLPYTGANVS